MQNTKDILRYVITGGLFIIPFIAFIVPNGFFFPFITGKGFTFRILVEVLFGLFALLAFIDASYRPKLSWITKSVLFFTIAILIADIFGENAHKSLWSNYERMEGFVLIAHLFLYYIVASSVFKTVTDWNRYFNVSIIASVGMSLFGVSQLLGKSVINQGADRLDGTFGNSAYFAIYLVLHIFLCLYMLAKHSKQVWLKWTYGSIILLEVVILYFTATRGAILGLIGGLIITGLIIAFKEKENVFFRKLAYGLLVGVAVVVLGFVSIKNTDYAKNSKVLSRFTTLSFSEIKTQGRYYVWPMATKGFLERPILGWGQENFNFVFNKYYDPGLFGQEEWFDRTHNVFLDWLIAGGLVGFAGYASMYVAMFYYVWRRKSRMSVSEKAIFTGMIAAYIFHNIFVFDNLISYIIFFFLLAYIHSTNSGEKEENNLFYTKAFSKDALVWVVSPAIVILTVGTIYFVNVPALVANTTLIESIQPQKEGAEKNLSMFKEVFSSNSFGSSEALEQLIQATVQVYSGQLPDKIKQDFYNLSKLELEKKIKEVPNDARYLVFAGSFFNRFGQYDEAIKYLEQALKESPNKQSIYFELGSSYLGKGDRQKMFELFKKAYELKPSSDTSKMIYIVGAIYTNNTGILKEILPTANQQMMIKDNRILKAYSDVGNYTAVIEILNARIQMDPTNKEDKLLLASAYATTGNKQKAIALLREVIVMDPSFKDQGEYYINEINKN